MRMLRGLRSGLFLVALGVIAAPGWAAETDKLLPNDTKAVVTINIKQVLDSALVKKLDDKLNIKTLLKRNGEAKELLDTFGVDLTKDIDQIVLVMTGAKGEESLLLVRGPFNRTKLEAAAKDDKNGVKVLKEGNYTLYEKAEKKTGELVYGAIVDDSTLAASLNKDFVLDVLDKKAGKKTATLKKEFAELLAKADGKLSVSVVALPQGLGGPQLAELVDKLKTVAGGVNITEDIKLKLSMVGKDDDKSKDAAKLIDEGLTQAKALAGILAGNQKQLAPLIDILDTFKVEAKGNDVTLKGEVNKDLIDKLLKMIGQPQQ